MQNKILVFYGSYRTNRQGIRLAQYFMRKFSEGGDTPELIDAKVVGLPILDKMYKEFPRGSAPDSMEGLAEKIRTADAFVFVVGEYNWSVQPGLKNLTDHFLEEWALRPAAIASYSAGRLSGVRSALAWQVILAEMGMAVVPNTLAVGSISETLSDDSQPMGKGGDALERAYGSFAQALTWWTEAAKNQRLTKRSLSSTTSPPQISR